MTTPTYWNFGTVNSTNSGSGGNSQYDTKVVSLDDGGFVVFWFDDSDAGPGSRPGTDIIGQRYDVEGNAVGSEFLANPTFSTALASEFTATTLTDGTVVIAFEKYSPTGQVGINTVEWAPDFSSFTSREIKAPTAGVGHDGPELTANSDGTYDIHYLYADSSTDTEIRVHTVDPQKDTVSGEKTFVLDGHSADKLIVVARSAGAERDSAGTITAIVGRIGLLTKDTRKAAVTPNAR